MDYPAIMALALSGGSAIFIGFCLLFAGIRREDAGGSVTQRPSTLLAALTRRITRLWTNHPACRYGAGAEDCRYAGGAYRPCPDCVHRPAQRAAEGR